MTLAQSCVGSIVLAVAGLGCHGPEPQWESFVESHSLDNYWALVERSDVNDSPEVAAARDLEEVAFPLTSESASLAMERLLANPAVSKEVVFHVLQIRTEPAGYRWYFEVCAVLLDSFEDAQWRVRAIEIAALRWQDSVEFWKERIQIRSDSVNRADPSREIDIYRDVSIMVDLHGLAERLGVYPQLCGEVKALMDVAAELCRSEGESHD